MAIENSDVDFSSPEALKAFYTRLYPFTSIFRWLNQQDAPAKLFTHREFAFTLPNDIYLRFQSFSSAADFKRQVLGKIPKRFEIGPIYSIKPRDRKINEKNFTALKRELVFDIDLTDYDPVRTCCTDAGICKRCWAFIAAAVKVLEEAVRDQFGYEHLLWVYSGRRGIHLWISDEEAMELSDEQRKAVVGWLTVVHNGKDSGKKVNVRIGSKSLPPSLASLIPDLADIFSNLILEDQDTFASTDGYEALLQLIPDGSIVHTLRSKWSSDPGRSSSDKWSDLKGHIKKSADRASLTASLEDIILQYTYPRLDAEVSKHRNHLLKAPFCIHPKTGRVCVPVYPDTVDQFDPEGVPTIGQLLEEVSGPEQQTGGEEEWRHTSLKPYVEMLDEHVKKMQDAMRRAKNETRDTTW